MNLIVMPFSQCRNNIINFEGPTFLLLILRPPHVCLQPLEEMSGILLSNFSRCGMFAEHSEKREGLKITV